MRPTVNSVEHLDVLPHDEELDRLLDRAMPPVALIDPRRRAALGQLASELRTGERAQPVVTGSRRWPWGLAAAAAALAVAGAATLASLPESGTPAVAVAPVVPFAPGSGGTSVADRWIVVEPAVFLLGSPLEEEGRRADEGPVPVRLTRRFSIQATEVTQGQWRALMGTDFFAHNAGDLPGYPDRARMGSRPDLPADLINWYSALAYCNRKSEAEGFAACYVLDGCSDGRPGSLGVPGLNYSCERVEFAGLDCPGYRLPTEAEWELAAGSGLPTPPSTKYAELAWTTFDARNTPHPVAQKAPNARGLYDTLGNVSEWTWSRYADELEGGVDPLGAPDGERRVLKGGAYTGRGQTLDALQWRVGRRFPAQPESRLAAYGFRPVRTLR